MGGDGDPAKRAVETALAAGKSVVTANKALLAKHGAALADLAQTHGGTLNFEAAVGGAIPVVKTLREGLAGNSFARIYGILNGTCNYILTRMEQERLSFAECLKDAQRLGYAEADPTFDVEGFDTAQKLAILASIAFGTRVNPDAVFVEGISSIAAEDLEAAAELGYRVKLLGVAVRTADGIEQRVHPTMVPRDRHRPGHGRHQRGLDRCRRHPSDHAGRPRRRRRRDGIGGGRRSRRHRPRGAGRGVRPAAGVAYGDPPGADAAARRRLLHPPSGARPARHLRDHREASRRRDDFARNRSCSAIAANAPMAATTRTARPCRRRSF